MEREEYGDPAVCREQRTQIWVEIFIPVLGLHCDAGFDTRLSLCRNTEELLKLLGVRYRDPREILYVEKERGLLLEKDKKLSSLSNAPFLSLVLY
ncbi:MAG: hypothetical protein IKE21_05755 [Erysipelotrichaceae bacterium]|nr:hypothetical protein [Erysipelotrichaceae bacterium]